MERISLGSRLTELRIAMGLSQRNIANEMNVGEKIIIAIENGQLTDAPIIFIKNYVRTYAKIVNLPSEEYEACLDALSQQIVMEQTKKRLHTAKKSRKKWLMVSALIISCQLGAVSYYLWSESQNKKNFVEVSEYMSPSFSARTSD